MADSLAEQQPMRGGRERSHGSLGGHGHGMGPASGERTGRQQARATSRGGRTPPAFGRRGDVAAAAAYSTIRGGRLLAAASGETAGSAVPACLPRLTRLDISVITRVAGLEHWQLATGLAEPGARQDGWFERAVNGPAIVSSSGWRYYSCR